MTRYLKLEIASFITLYIKETKYIDPIDKSPRYNLDKVWLWDRSNLARENPVDFEILRNWEDPADKVDPTGWDTRVMAPITEEEFTIAFLCGIGAL